MAHSTQQQQLTTGNNTNNARQKRQEQQQTMTINNKATATNRSPKRVRFNDQNEVITVNDSTGERMKPIDAVKNHISIMARSHPSSMQQLLTDRALQFTLIQSKIKQKNEVKAKFSENDFIPRSARFDFKLTSIESVTETTEFTTLTSTCATAIQTCQSQLKQAMLKVIELELTSFDNERMTLFCNTLKQISEIVMVMHKSDTTTHNKLALYALTTHHSTLLEHFKNSTLEIVKKKYKSNAAIADDFADVPNSAEKALFDKMLPTIQTAVQLCFVDSWNKLTEAREQQDLDSKVSATIQKYNIVSVTEATAMEIDNEPAVKPKILKNIIGTEIATTNRTIEKRLLKLEQALRRNNPMAKNLTKGDNTKPSAALSKKKKEGNKVNRQNGMTNNDSKKNNKPKKNLQLNSKTSKSNQTQGKIKNKNKRNNSPNRQNTRNASADDDDNDSSTSNRSEQSKRSNASPRSGRGRGNKK